MPAVQEIMAELRALPRWEPDPVWKQRTKEKLLALMAERQGAIDTTRRWAVFATYDLDPTDFAQWVCAKGRHWRPLAVHPERLQRAVASIQPNLVVVDSRLRSPQRLVRMVRASSMAHTAIAAQYQLAAVA